MSSTNTRKNKVLTHILLTLCFLVMVSGSFTDARSAEVLVVTWSGDFASETAFRKRLKELQPDVKFRQIDAARDKHSLMRTLRDYDMSGIDLVYSFGTTGSKIVKNYLNGRIPQIFNLVSDPILSNIVKSLEKPGENITGTPLLISLDTQFEVLAKLKNYKSLAVWFDPREQQSIALLPQIKKIVEKRGAQFVPFRLVPDTASFSEYLAGASEQTNKMDALYIIPTTSFQQHYKQIHEKLSPSLLVMGGTRRFVEGGSTIALASTLEERGETAAELAHKVLSGTPAGDIPIQLVGRDKAVLYVNRKKMTAAGITDINSINSRIEYVD